MKIHPVLGAVTARIRARSAQIRSVYLARLDQARKDGAVRKGLSSSNLAHAFAAFEPNDKLVLREARQANIALVALVQSSGRGRDH